MFQRSSTISCFLSMPGEIDTESIAVETIKAGRKGAFFLRKLNWRFSGKALFVPRITEDRQQMQMLRIYSEEDLLSVKPLPPWGIREPTAMWQGTDRKDGRSFNLTWSTFSFVLIKFTLVWIWYWYQVTCLSYNTCFNLEFRSSIWIRFLAIRPWWRLLWPLHIDIVWVLPKQVSTPRWSMK